MRVCVLRMAFLPFLLPPIRQFLDGLSARGHDVTLIKTYPRDRSRPEEPRETLRNWMLPLWTRKLPKSKFIAPLVFMEFVFRSIPLGLFLRPRLVIAIDVDTLLQGVIIATLTRAKLLYYSVELYTDRPGFEPKAFWVWLERRLINKADLVVACEPNRARVLMEKYCAKTLPMTVLNVPPYTPLVRGTRIHEYLAERGIRDKKVALYVGELNKGRCIGEFIEAAQWFRDDVLLFLLGPIAEGFDVEARIKESKVEDRVILHPPVPPSEVMAFMCSADLGLQTQKDDGLNHRYCAPIKLFQYLMAGLPVLSSDFPGMIEVVTHNEVGLCVDPENTRAIADSINEILGNDTLRKRMSDNALRIAKDQYCYELEGAKLFAAVDEMLAVPKEKRSAA